MNRFTVLRSGSSDDLGSAAHGREEEPVDVISDTSAPSVAGGAGGGSEGSVSGAGDSCSGIRGGSLPDDMRIAEIVSGKTTIEVEDGQAYPRQGESFGAFARRVQPSKVPKERVEGLQVRAMGDPLAEGDPERVNYEASAAVTRAELEAYRREWIDCKEKRQVPGDVKVALWKRVYESAIKHGAVCGKWMMFVKKRVVDQTWQKITIAMEEGKLGCSAMVTPCRELGPDGRALICVFVSDFTDRADVRRVLVGLKKLGLLVQNGFKADALTSADLDSQALKPLRLNDSWQLHLDLLREVFPPKGWQTRGKMAGFDFKLLKYEV